MRFIRHLTVPGLLAALLGTMPQLALGQDDEIHFDTRPGTEIQSDELAGYLVKNLSVGNLPYTYTSVSLRVEMISREHGVVGKYESKAVEIEPGKTYPASLWIPAPRLNEALAPGFGDRRKIGFLGFGVWSAGYIEEVWTDRRCDGASHAIRLVVGQEGLFEEVAFYYLCISVDR